MIFRKNSLYRSTGVVLGELEVTKQTQLKTFTPSSKAEDFVYAQALRNLEAVDEVNNRYGKHKVHIADSLAAQRRHEGGRAWVTVGWMEKLFKAECIKRLT